MTHQVLIASMNQTDFSLIERMNIQSDAIVGNQCDRCSDKEILVSGHRIIYLNRKDRGVGKNRNEVLLRSTADILTFADADMTFVNGYSEIIQKAFTDLKDADAIIFNIETVGGETGGRINDKTRRVRIYNALNYGTARLSVRADCVKRENIFFHTYFGGGTPYSAGEDSLFIVDMLKHGLHVYVHPAYVALVDQTYSTWFSGYSEKYLYDKGALFAAISGRFSSLLCLQDLVRHTYLWRDNGIGFKNAFRLMDKGKKGFRKLISFTNGK